jgi:hypothetical protein
MPRGGYSNVVLEDGSFFVSFSLGSLSELSVFFTFFRLGDEHSQQQGGVYASTICHFQQRKGITAIFADTLEGVGGARVFATSCCPILMKLGWCIRLCTRIAHAKFQPPSSTLKKSPRIALSLGGRQEVPKTGSGKTTNFLW